MACVLVKELAVLPVTKKAIGRDLDQLACLGLEGTRDFALLSSAIRETLGDAASFGFAVVGFAVHAVAVDRGGAG
jgi:hypothetical protein